MEGLPPGGHFRRSEHLVSFWSGDELRVRNFATDREAVVDDLDLRILDRSRRWATLRTIARDLEDPVEAVEIERRVGRLMQASFLRSLAGPQLPGELAMARWEGWNPAAGFFHSATRDVAYAGPPDAKARPLVRGRAYPDPLRHHAGSVVSLPPCSRDGALAETLLGRRTWRRFGGDPVPLRDLSTLLGLTWGVQAWVGDPPAALKTSPSGGAKHGIEAYVVASDVENLDPGTYHYDPDVHTLTVISDEPPQRDAVAAMLAGQEMYSEAAALVFMTCVFERVHYKYRFARAYRVVLVEAGHLGQTFLVLASGLGLAPFCTAALSDSLVEQHLGIDGIGEAVLYAVGIGSRPADVAWAPTEEERELPARRPPTHAGGAGPWSET